MNDTDQWILIEVGTLWSVEGAAPAGGGSEVCLSRLAHDNLLKEGDFAQRRRFLVPPDGIVALDCSPTLLIASDARGAFGLPEGVRELEVESDEDASRISARNRANDRGLIFLRCERGRTRCRFEPGTGSREFVLLPDAYDGQTSSCYDTSTRAYAELSSLWPHSRLLGTRADAEGCLVLDMESAPADAFGPDAGTAGPDAGPTLGPAWDDGGAWDDAAVRDDAGVWDETPAPAAAGHPPGSGPSLAFLPVAYTQRVCMDPQRFPFTAGELLQVSSTTLSSASMRLTFSTGGAEKAGPGACGPLRMACGAVIQPLDPDTLARPGRDATLGLAHDVWLPNGQCGISMQRSRRWVEWMQLEEIDP